jgi:cell division septation protein DedD
MRFTYRAAGPVAAAAVLTLLCGCSRTQQDWRAAQQAGTPRAYQAFVERHPASELAAVARQRMAQLTEQAAWQQAARENTAAAYQEYLTRYPNGSWSQDARIRMESLSLPNGTGRAAGLAAAAEPATAAARPAAAPAPQAAQPVASSASPPAAGRREAGEPAVQLGAFSSSANARAAWSQLAARFGPELRGLTPRVVPVTSSGRRLYRLEAGVADPAAGRRLCRQLQQHAQGCLPLP